MKRLLLFPLLVAVACHSAGSAPEPAASGLDVSLVDKAVRPQDDFFRHVNGGWLSKTEIPADKSSYGSFVELADKSEADIKAIVEEAANNPNAPAGSIVRQVGDFYVAFMNQKRADELGAAPLKPELARIDALKTTADFAREVGELSARGLTGPVGGFIEADAKDPNTPILYLVQAGTALPDRDYYLKTEAKFANIRAKYEEYLTKVLTLAGQPSPAADAKAVLGLETALARVQWTAVESRDSLKTFNKYPFAKLATEFPGFDWAGWAKPQGVDRVSELVVSQPSFFKAFAAMVPSTPLATWKSWLAAQYITTSAPYLGAPFVDANFEFFGKVLAGQQEQKPRVEARDRARQHEPRRRHGQALRRAAFPRGRESAHAADDRQSHRGVSPVDFEPGLDDTRHAQSRAREAVEAVDEDWLPREVGATTRRSWSRLTTSSATSSARRSSRTTTRCRSSANRSIAPNG